MTASFDQSLDEKVKRAHQKQIYPQRGKRYAKDSKDHIQQIIGIKNELPNLLKKIDRWLEAADILLADLEEAGMLEGYVQFKDEDKMQLYTSQQQGQRIRLYVGNDLDRQVQASKYLANFERHKKVSGQAADTAYGLRHAFSRIVEGARILAAIKLTDLSDEEA